MKRRTFVASGAALAGGALSGAPLAFAQAQAGAAKVAIAVGGKNLFYYLPLTIAERRNYFKDEGLDVEISDFAGGAKALQAAVGGSADVVSGAFEHTLLLQAKGQMFREFVLQGRAPQIVLAVSKKAMPNYKSIADLKGKKIGVTAPGSSTSIMASFVLAKAGLTASDVAFIGVGAGAGAIAALQSGQIDAHRESRSGDDQARTRRAISASSPTRARSRIRRASSAATCRRGACTRRRASSTRTRTRRRRSPTRWCAR